MDLHKNTMFNMIVWIFFCLFVFKKALWQTCGFSARKRSRAVNNWCFDDSHTGINSREVSVPENSDLVFSPVIYCVLGLHAKVAMSPESAQQVLVSNSEATKPKTHSKHTSHMIKG